MQWKPSSDVGMFYSVVVFLGGLKRWHPNRAEHCFPCFFPARLQPTLLPRGSSIVMFQEKENFSSTAAMSCLSVAVRYTLFSPALQHWPCSGALTRVLILTLMSRDNDKCTVHINNNYSITVILHTRNTTGCFPCSKCCPSPMPWFTLFLPHFQLCHLIMNAKKSWLAVGDCESTGKRVPDSLRMQGSAECFSEQRL